MPVAESAGVGGARLAGGGGVAPATSSSTYREYYPSAPPLRETDDAAGADHRRSPPYVAASTTTSYRRTNETLDERRPTRSEASGGLRLASVSQLADGLLQYTAAPSAFVADHATSPFHASTPTPASFARSDGQTVGEPQVRRLNPIGAVSSPPLPRERSTPAEAVKGVIRGDTGLPRPGAVHTVEPPHMHPRHAPANHVALRAPVAPPPSAHVDDNEDLSTMVSTYVPEPDDNAPVVPYEQLPRARRHGRHEWERHPAAPVVLMLLRRRGVSLPQHSDLIDYHMAVNFLEHLRAAMEGTYLVRYAPKNAPPKERYFAVQMQSDRFGQPCPYLVIYVHRQGVQVVDRISLGDLVGVTTGIGPKSLSFRRYLAGPGLITGSFVGQHRARLSTKGAFSLWFFDRESRRPRSLDVLTTNMGVFDLWVKTMQGVLSVNSVCLHRADVAQDLERLMQYVQQLLWDAAAAEGDRPGDGGEAGGDGPPHGEVI